ncbi:hypothetical protein B0T17DRAFT_600570 [Bombardia bombarda]|uniref:Uncharacterized protein n=1 Tax=Bombardia bombarda TaxID=252184 RepID=A0AA39WUX0_9PEZI|nr:hypothetical protein B0T17DRAFT_600570 [Bombardia bombarda]
MLPLSMSETDAIIAISVVGGIFVLFISTIITYHIVRELREQFPRLKHDGGLNALVVIVTLILAVPVLCPVAFLYILLKLIAFARKALFLYSVSDCCAPGTACCGIRWNEDEKKQQQQQQGEQGAQGQGQEQDLDLERNQGGAVDSPPPPFEGMELPSYPEAMRMKPALAQSYQDYAGKDGQVKC